MCMQLTTYMCHWGRIMNFTKLEESGPFLKLMRNQFKRREATPREENPESGQSKNPYTLSSYLVSLYISFFTRSDRVPPLGYESITLSFNKDYLYPTASTCAVKLTVPTIHNDYNAFKLHMDVAMTMHGGFGLV